MSSRSADRHNPEKQTGVYARLDNADLNRFDIIRQKLGIPSRRQAIITAVREWLARNENEDTK